MAVSDTPRCDAVEQKFSFTDPSADPSAHIIAVVPSHVARNLERELAAAKNSAQLRLEYISKVDARRAVSDTNCPHGALHGIGCGSCVNELVRDGRRYRHMRDAHYGPTAFSIKWLVGPGANQGPLWGMVLDEAVDRAYEAVKASGVEPPPK